MDFLVFYTMKNAAKRDMYCELQDSVNHQIFERTLRSEVLLRSMLCSATFNNLHTLLLVVFYNESSGSSDLFHIVMMDMTLINSG